MRCPHRSILLLAVAVLCIGCSSDRSTEEAMERALGNDADVTMKDGETVALDLGDNAIVMDGSLPSDWPSDVPKYPHGTIDSVLSSTSGELLFSLLLTTDDEQKTVSDWYMAELKANGWAIDETVTSAEGGFVIGTKDERSILVSALTTDGQTSVTVSISNAAE